ncbi:uncharacterized protein [Periplaneta americana]|uniref:uncharacterized protein isoform X2 n=1 Tax=Periplaneta americana TaxID=6978 RepID=UPI0037E71CFC
MFHLDKTTILCYILCGMLAVCYLPVYVIGSVVVVFFLLLYYDTKFNVSRFHLLDLARRNPLRRILVSFRVTITSVLISVMKTCDQLRSVSQSISTNGVAVCAEENASSLVKSPQGNYTSSHYSGVEEDSFKYSNRSSFNVYSVSSKSNDSIPVNRSQRLQNQTNRYSRVSEDLSFSPKGSPWGKSVSPKLRSHGSGVKTVQTVAGPLLASTRFNINLNSGLYGDVNSPGFSSRIARYANENTKTLTHQKQYSGPGQFPLVQLDRTASLLPVLSSRKSHTPVTVRIAPPESSDSRILSKSQILSGSSIQEQQSSKSVLEVLKEISRKRIHAQLDDSEEDDIIKRQRKAEGQNTSELSSENRMVQDDIMAVGKRMREESPNQTELNCRPLQQQNKRTRNNEILSSLSSSRNLLNNLKTNKRKSSSADWSRSSTPVMGKPPKQSRESIVETIHILKKAVEEAPTVTSITTPTTSAITSAPHPQQQQEEEIPVTTKPSEFLPKFAAVLDKSSGPVLNSVAALEAKRVHDSKTRLRSMLAVIAGEDDFMRKPLPSTSANGVPAVSILPMTTVSTIFTPISAAGIVATAKEITTAAETIVTSSTPSFSLGKSTTNGIQAASSAETVPVKSIFSTTSVLSPVSSTAPNTSAAGTGFSLLSSITSAPVTSILNQTAPTLPLTTSPVVATLGEQVKPILTLTPETSTNLASAVSSTEQKTEFLTKPQNVTVSSPITFNFGTSQVSNPPLSSSAATVTALPKASFSVSDINPQLTVSSSQSLVTCNGSTIISPSTLQSGFGSLANTSSNSSGIGSISSTSASTVIHVSKSPATETSKSLFSFGNKSAAITSTHAITTSASGPGFSSGVGFMLGSNQAALGLFGSSSPSTTTTTTGVISPASGSSFSVAKTNDKPYEAPAITTLTSTLGFGMKPASSSSSPFQSNIVTTSSSLNPIGGFKFDFSKGIKDNAGTSSAGSFQPLAAPSSAVTSSTITVPSTTTTTTITFTSTTSPPTIATTISTLTTTAATSQSSTPFQFGPSALKSVFNFNTTTNTTQSTGCFFQTPQQVQADGGSQKQSPFKFGTGSSQTSGFPFGNPLSGIKPSGFSFSGSGNLSNQTAGGMFGSTGSTTGQATQLGGSVFGTGGNLTETSTQPVFGVGGSKTDQPQVGGGIFGNTSQSSGGVFGTSTNTSSQTSQQNSGLFGNLTNPSGGMFGSGSSTSGQSQPSTGLFGSGSSTPSQPLLSSTGVFGSTSNQITPQPSGGLFGSNTSLTTPTTQSSGSVFGSGGNLTPQSSGGPFSSNANVPTPSSQASSGLFGNIGSPAVQTSQSSGSLFGSPSTQLAQSSGGMFGSGSSSTAQPSGGVFASSGNAQPMFGFGSTPAATPVQQTSTSTSTGLFGTSTSLQTPFQFGASSNSTSSTAPQSTGGFNFGSSGVNPSAPAINFSAGTSSSNTAFQFGAGAAPMFSGQPSGQGMFSIGSGSTAPRARATRMRRQRRRCSENR